MTATMTHNAPSMMSLSTPRGKTIENAEKPPTPNDLHKLKEISEKLNLTTRRPSVVQWKQIIELRKSRGQYVTSREPQYLDSMVAQSRIDTDNEELDNRKPEIDPRKIHASLFQDSFDTPTKMPSSDPTEASVPTPTRRFRRIAHIAIPEINVEDYSNDDDDVTNNNVSIVSSQSTTSTLSDVEMEDASHCDVTNDDSDISTRYRKITQAFEKIRRDLVIMRIEDNKLARKLLDVRSEMTVVRAQCSCQEHAEMLDDVTFELEEEEEVTGLIKACDLSDRKPALLLSEFSPLRNIGVSRMNLNRRRFSIR